MTQPQDVFQTTTKLWQVLQLALMDLEIAEADDCVHVSMGSWHAPFEGECRICLAGAVMRQTMKVSDNVDIMPSYFNAIIEARLHALNLLRTGDIEGGWCRFNADMTFALPAGIPKQVYVADYDLNRDGWWKDMEEILDTLKTADI